MPNQSLKARRRRVPAKYAALAAAVAVLGALVIETAGTSLKRSYSGLGGRLEQGPAKALTPVAAPAR